MIITWKLFLRRQNMLMYIISYIFLHKNGNSPFKHKLHLQLIVFFLQTYLITGTILWPTIFYNPLWVMSHTLENSGLGEYSIMYKKYFKTNVYKLSIVYQLCINLIVNKKWLSKSLAERYFMFNVNTEFNIWRLNFNGH